MKVVRCPFKARALGQKFELLAQRFLEKKYLKTLAHNYSTPRGEIDLIMRDAQTLVFVEVRYRKNNSYGTALESIDWKKQKRIIQTAQHFIAKQQYQGSSRFDVVSFDGENAEPQWYQNAFAPDDVTRSI